MNMTQTALAEHTSLVFFCLVIAGLSAEVNAQVVHSLDPRNERPSQQSVDLVPITIAISNVGSFTGGDSWYLSMNSDGKCVLTIESFPRIVQRFDVGGKQIEELRTLLARENLFELKDEYGIKYFDSGIQTLTVTIGAHSKSINVLNMGSVDDKLKIRECARVLRIHQNIRSWFDDKHAFDYREINKRTLNRDKEG